MTTRTHTSFSGTRMAARLTSLLPQLSIRPGARGAPANLASLLLLGAFGAAMLHTVAFHLRAGSTGAYLLAHCPWRPVLAIAALMACLNGVLLREEAAGLLRERRRLAAQLRLDTAPDGTVHPRRIRRLAGIALSLYLLESGTTVLALHLAPMRAPMLMGGHSMIMAVTPTFPLPIGQLLLAALLATVLWLAESRLQRLRGALTRLRRLAALLIPSLVAAPRVADCALRAPRLLHGFRILSRPPPVRRWA